MKENIESNESKTMILLLNIVMVFLLLLLALATDKISNKGVLLIYISTWIIVLHIWLGAHYIVKYLKVKIDIWNVLLDIVPLVCMTLAVINFYRLTLWSSLFAILFTVAIIKYGRVYLSSKDQRIKEYTLKKIKNEVIAVPLLIFLAVYASLFERNSSAMIFIQSITLAFQILFAVWLIHIKKVYKIFKE